VLLSSYYKSELAGVITDPSWFYQSWLDLELVFLINVPGM
jgi:hypothetical protein